MFNPSNFWGALHLGGGLLFLVDTLKKDYNTTASPCI